MDISYWSLGQILAKVLLYAGFAAGIGGLFTQFISPGHPALYRFNRRYSLIFLVVAMVAAVAVFFLQVGALSESGITGMADSLMRQLVWNTNAGPALLYQVSGLSGLLLAAVSPIAVLPGRWRLLIGALWIGAAVLFASGLAIVGHTAQVNNVVKGVLTLHVIVMAWWLGALWPLRRACVELDQTDLYALMRCFSQYANGVVAVLVVCGGLLIWQLLESWQDLFATAYGRLLLLKLSAVAAILGLAAWHKWGLTEKLLTERSARRRLHRSIAVEMGVASGILVITAILTTVVGPTH